MHVPKPMEPGELLVVLSNSPTRWDRGRGAVAVLAGVTGFVAAFAALEVITGRPLLASLSAARSAYLPTLERSTFAGVQRLGSLFFNADWMAVALTFGLAIWVGTALATSGSTRTVATAVAAGMLALAFATLTRSVFIGAPAAFLAIFVVGRSGERWRLAVRAVAVVAAVLYLAPGLAHTALARLEDPARSALRIGAARTAADIIAAYPLAGLGMGWERYEQLAEPYRDVSRQYIPLAHPHNSYLELGAMLGIPGLCAFAGLTWMGLRAAGRGALSGAETAAFAGMVVLLVMSLTVNAVTLPFLSTLFWVSWWVVADRGARADG
jgi:putative inorganic carbon (HCO3(-)) transporter